MEKTCFYCLRILLVEKPDFRVAPQTPWKISGVTTQLRTPSLGRQFSDITNGSHLFSTHSSFTLDLNSKVITPSWIFAKNSYLTYYQTHFLHPSSLSHTSSSRISGSFQILATSSLPLKVKPLSPLCLLSTPPTLKPTPLMTTILNSTNLGWSSEFRF